MTGRQHAGATVLGCGRMGSALARALAAAGTPVTVWNRTHEKAEALVADNVRAVRDPGAAIAAADLVVACLGDYADVTRILEDEDLSGKTIVNVTTGTSLLARRQAKALDGRGAAYLDGAVICYPANVGTERGTVLVSGEQSAWSRVAPILSAWGTGVEWVGEEIGLANTLDSAIVGGFHVSALLAFTEAAQYALAGGVPEDVLMRVGTRALANLPERMEMTVRAIATGEYENTQAHLSTYAHAMRDYVRDIIGEGHSVPLMERSSEVLSAAERRGLGGLGIAAVTIQDPNIAA